MRKPPKPRSVVTRVSSPSRQEHVDLMEASVKGKPPAVARACRRVQAFVGFKKGYSFVLWSIFGGALLGFTLARLPYLNFHNFCPNGAGPGECYWYMNFPRYRVGITIHLAGVLPASLLAILQFVPSIRRRNILYHRIAGYTAIILSLVGTVGALMIVDRAFGGDFSTRIGVGVLGLAFLTALSLALYNIRRKQLDQHRAWMLRAWFYAGTIVTMRLIFVVAAKIIALYPLEQALYVAMPCDAISFMLDNDSDLMADFPDCAALASGNHTLGHALQAPVIAKFGAGLVESAAAIHATFGGSTWLALLLHAVGVEIYLRLTPREAERLRQISYHRQLELGYEHPGSAGLVAERFGDAEPWLPPGRLTSSAPSTLSQTAATGNRPVEPVLGKDVLAFATVA